MNTFRDRFLTPTEVTATVEIPEAPTVAQEYELVSVEAIQPHPDNARRGDIKTIRESIRNNGFVGACVVQRSSNHILVGNHRYLAAVEEGLTEIPVMWVDKSDIEAKRLLVADNRTADLASYDDAALGDLLAALETDELQGTGFTQDDLDLILLTTSVDDIDLSDLEEEYPYADDTERNLWRRLPMTLPPDLFDECNEWWGNLAGEDDIEKARNLMTNGVIPLRSRQHVTPSDN